MKASLPFLFLMIFFLNVIPASSGLGRCEDIKEVSEVPIAPLKEDSTTTHNTTSENCEFKNIPLYGKVKFVESFPTDCGKWQIVESFPDFTVQVVTSISRSESENRRFFSGNELIP